MRVTEGRMMELATEGMEAARDRVAAAGAPLTNGIKVALPSDDPAAWAEGMRVQVRTALSRARGDAIVSAQAQLQATDGALASVSNTLARARELAVSMANGTLNAADRAAAAMEVRALRSQALSSADERSAGGEYLLSGSQSSTQPFDLTTGAYQGDARSRSIDVAEGISQVATVPGSRLTAASGVDVFAVLDSFANALDANDVPGITTALGNLDSGVSQVATARAEVGSRLAALAAADETRTALEQTLADQHAKAVEADPIAAASELAQAKNALEAAQAAATQIIALAEPKV